MYRIEYNGTVIHDPSKFSSDCILMECTYSGEIGKVDTLDFTILPFHPFYNEFTRLQTGIVAYRDDHEIFRGRILSSSVDLYGNKKVQCEGSLAYLLDTIQPKMVYAEEDETAVSGAQLFRTIIANHNSQVEEVKRFTVGEITALKANDIIEVNQTSYTETRSMIDQYLLNPKGGYLRVRYENGVQYIDWVEDFGRNPNQTIKVGANVISFTEEISADDFYTVLFPIGTEKAVTRDTEEEIEEDDKKDHTVTIASINNDSPYLLVSQEFVNKYGYIYHNEDYGTVANPAELLQLANDTMAQFRKKLNRTVEIGGLDLHFIDPDVDQILLGDRVQIIAPNFDKNERLMLTKIDYDFQDPSKDKFSFGDGLQTLTKRTEANISHTSSTAKKAKNDSLTNGRDLFIKKNLIDIQANNMSVKVNEAMKVVADTIDFSFRKLKWESEAYTIQSDMEKAAIRAQFDNEWSQVTRSMAGYIDTEQGMATFSAISNIVGSMGRQNNTVTAALDSDQGFFSWRSTQNTISEQGNYLQTLGVTVNGDDHTVGLVAKTDQALDDLGDVSRTVSNVSLTLCGDQNHPGIVSEVGQYIDGNLVNSVINQDATTVKISAQKVDLGDYATVGMLEADYITAAQLQLSGGADAYSISVDNVDTNTIFVDGLANIGQIETGECAAADFVFNDGVHQQQSLQNAIKDVQIAGPTNNVYKLQYKRFTDADWQDASVTFSRATTLGRGWSGGDLTVTATPQGNRFVHHLGRGVENWNQYELSIPIVYSENSDYDTVLPTGYTLTIDLSSKHDEWAGDGSGWESAKLNINVDEKEISITNQGDIVSASIRADTPLGNNGYVYNSETRNYSFRAAAKANNAVMDTIDVTTGTEAYRAGYNANNTARLSAVRSSGATSAGTLSYGETVTVTAQYMTYDGDIINTSRSLAYTAPADRYSQGQTAAGLNINASNATISRATSSDVKSANISNDIDVYYDYESMVYMAHVKTYANDTLIRDDYNYMNGRPQEEFETAYRQGYEQAVIDHGGGTSSNYTRANYAKKGLTRRIAGVSNLYYKVTRTGTEHYMLICSSGTPFAVYTGTDGWDELYVKN